MEPSTHDQHSVLEKVCLYSALLFILVLSVIMTSLAGISYQRVKALTGGGKSSDPLSLFAKSLQLFGHFAKSADDVNAPSIKPAPQEEKITFISASHNGTAQP